MFELLGVVAVLILVVPFALLFAFACFAGTVLEGIGWLFGGAVKFVIGGIILAGLLLAGLFVIPFAIMFG